MWVIILSVWMVTACAAPSIASDRHMFNDPSHIPLSQTQSAVSLFTLTNISNSTSNATGVNETWSPSSVPTSVMTLAPTLVAGNVSNSTSNATGVNETWSPSSVPTSVVTLAPTLVAGNVSNSTSNATGVNETWTPSLLPSGDPTSIPTSFPSHTSIPSMSPTSKPTFSPTKVPTSFPTVSPTSAPSPHPSPRPTHRPTRVPTPHPQAGTTWWYATQAFVSVKWHPEQEENQDDANEDGLVDDLDHSFYAALQEMLDWDSQGMFTEIVVGSKDVFKEDSESSRNGGLRSRQFGIQNMNERRKLKLAVWNSFTLGVWTTASGSLHEVQNALDQIMSNQSILLDLIVAEGEHTTISEFLIHEITQGVTYRAPPGVDEPAEDSAGIALIIVWTLVVFLFGLMVVSICKSRCFGESKHDPFTYKAPSESLFHKMNIRNNGNGSRGSNKFGRLSEMEMSNSSLNSSRDVTNPLGGSDSY